MQEVAMGKPVGLRASLSGIGQLSKIDLLAFILALALHLQAPAFSAEDNLYFNYANNVQHPHIVYFYISIMGTFSLFRKWSHML